MTSSNGNIFRLPVIGGVPSQRPVVWSFDVFFGLGLNKWVSKQPRRRAFETPSHWLWRHCDTQNYLGQTVASISDVLHLCVQMVDTGYTLISDTYMIISCDGCSSRIQLSGWSDTALLNKLLTKQSNAGNLRRHNMHILIKHYTDMYLIYVVPK